MEPSKFIAVAALLLFSISGHVNGVCRCNIQHPQQAFCNHDFVIKALVKNSEEVLAENGYKEWHAQNFDLVEGHVGRQAPKKIVVSRIYEIQVIKVFKGSARVSTKKLKTVTQIKTPGTVKSCGVYLRKNQVYLLGGDAILQDLWVDGCSWVQKFRKLTRQNILGLNLKYKKSCNKCSIEQCTGKECDKHHGNCNFQQEIYSCFQDFGICHYSKRHKKCEWKKNGAFNRCLKNLKGQKG